MADAFGESWSDIQYVGDGYKSYSRYGSVLQVVHLIQVEQLQSWSRLDVLRKGGSLEAIQESIVSAALRLACYDHTGLKLIHIAAAYDRVDVLEWLVETNSLQLDELDRSKRSVLDVATASNWITRRLAEEHIHFFFVSSTRRPSRDQRKADPTSSFDCGTSMVSPVSCA